MPEERPVVHIGAPKTGTTWLQTALFPNVIGRTYGGYRGSNGLVNAALLQLTAPSGFAADAVRAVFRAHAPLLLSWEGLSCPFHTWRRDEPPLDEVADRLLGVLPDSHIVIFTRESQSWRRSSYSTYLRAGGCLRFEDYCDEVERTRADDWGLVASTYRSRFASVTEVAFEDVRGNLETGVRSIFQGLNVAFGEAGEGLPNMSLEGWRMHALRHMNRYAGRAKCEAPRRTFKGAELLARFIGQQR